MGRTLSDRALGMPPLIQLPEAFREDSIRLAVGDNGFLPPAPFLRAFREKIALVGHINQIGSLIKETPRLNSINKMISECGDKELRNLIAEKILDEKLGLHEYSGDHILITCGGQAAINVVALTILNHVREHKAITFAPFYPYHQAAIWMATKEKPLTVPLVMKGGDFQLNLSGLEEKLDNNPDTKLLVLCNPGNPTGYIFSKRELEALSDLAVEKDLWVLSDEVYSLFTYGDKKFISIASISGMKERTFLIGSFSKIYGLTGWRVGFLVSPEPIERSGLVKLKDTHDVLNIQPATICQWAIREALKEDDPFPHLSDWIRTLKKRRDMLIQALKRIDGMTPNIPEGAYYVFPRIENRLSEKLEAFINSQGRKQFEGRGIDLKLHGDKMQRFLDKEANVTTTPGKTYGSDFSNHIRIAFCYETTERIVVAAKRIEEAIRKL